MVSWGPYAVPAWAPSSGDHAKLVAENGWEHSLANDPRPEWYANGMRIPGSPTWAHHRSAWGRLARYESFGRLFRQGLKAWEPAPLADALAASGARYVIVSAKHHDGFLLWPSRKRNPKRREWQTVMDVVGTFAETTRERGMRFGVYYSGRPRLGVWRPSHPEPGRPAGGNPDHQDVRVLRGCPAARADHAVSSVHSLE